MLNQSWILVEIVKLGLVKILNFKFYREAHVWLRIWRWCLVEILKMKFDQDLCLNSWYELNPRVRCAFGNVYSFLWICCCSDCWWWNISRVKTRRRRPFTNGWRLYSQQVAWSSYKLTSTVQHFWTRSLFRKCWSFPAGLVASHSATRARTRTTDQPSNKYWTLLLLKQDFHNSFHNCSKDRESVCYYDGSRRNRMLQPDENDCYWLSLS